MKPAKKPMVILKTDSYIGQQFAARLGHPEVKAETICDDLRGVFTIRVKHIAVEFSLPAYRELKTCPVDDMPAVFESCLSR